MARSPLAARRSPLAARRSPLVLLFCSTIGQAWDDPLGNPDADGSVLGGHRYGDVPPPLCWPATTTKLKVLGPVFSGDTTVHIAGGSTTTPPPLTIGAGPFNLPPLWTCPVNFPTQDVAYPSPVTHNAIWYIHGGGVGTVASREVVVLGPPDPLEVYTPAAAHPIDAGSRAISVVGLHPGAVVDVDIGAASFTGWPVDASRVSIPIPSGTVAGTPVTITQTLPGATTSISYTSQAGNLGPQDVRTPFGYQTGALGVVVAGYRPGSMVRVWTTDPVPVLLGKEMLGEPMGVIPTCALPAEISVEATRGGTSVSRVTVADDWSADAASSVAITDDSMGDPFVCTADPAHPDCIVVTHPASMTVFTFGHWVMHRIYKPVGIEPRGVVFLVHGRNTSSLDLPGGYRPNDGLPPEEPDEILANRDDSFLAWDDLGELLAKAGFEVVSLDIHPNDIFEAFRGALIFQFVERYLGANNPPIAVLGLSMGGAGSAHAVTLLDTFGRGGSGRGVLAYVGLAPAITAGTLTTGVVPATPVNALIIDGEEDGFWKASTPFVSQRMENIWPFPFAHVVIPGGGHAYFNEAWDPAVHNDSPHVTRAAQNAFTYSLVQRYLTMVFDATSPTDITKGYAGLFSAMTDQPGHHQYRARAMWRAGTRQMIDDFDDGTTSPNTLGNPNQTTGGVVFSVGTPLAGHLLAPSNPLGAVKWFAPGQLRLTLAPNLVAPPDGAMLTFDVLPIIESVDPFLPGDFQVELRDAQGDVARVWAGISDEVDPPMANLPGQIRSWPETIAIPLRAFRAVNPALNLNQLDRLAFRFGDGPFRGVYLDDIAFTSP